jgi:hypothetical protein
MAPGLSSLLRTLPRILLLALAVGSVHLFATSRSLASNLLEELEIAMELELTGDLARNFVEFLDFEDWQRRYPQGASTVLNETRSQYPRVARLVDLPVSTRWQLVRSITTVDHQDQTPTRHLPPINLADLRINPHLPLSLRQALSGLSWDEDSPGVLEMRNSEPPFMVGQSAFLAKLQALSRALGIWDSWILQPMSMRRQLQQFRRAQEHPGFASLQLNVSHPTLDLTTTAHLWNLTRMRLRRTTGIGIHSGFVSLGPIDQKGLIRLRNPHWVELRAIVYAPQTELQILTRMISEPEPFIQLIRQDLAAGTFLTELRQEIAQRIAKGQRPTSLNILRNLVGFLESIHALQGLCPDCNLLNAQYADQLQRFIRLIRVTNQGEARLLARVVTAGEAVLPITSQNDLRGLVRNHLPQAQLEVPARILLAELLLRSPSFDSQDLEIVISLIATSEGRLARLRLLPLLEAHLRKHPEHGTWLMASAASENPSTRALASVLLNQVSRNSSTPTRCAANLRDALRLIRVPPPIPSP